MEACCDGDYPGVYFLVCDRAGTTKIGMSATSVSGRVRNQLTSMPDSEVAVFAVRCENNPTPENLERELHFRFCDYRSHGEWFKIPNDCLSETLRNLSAIPIRIYRKPLPNWLGERVKLPKPKQFFRDQLAAELALVELEHATPKEVSGLLIEARNATDFKVACFAYFMARNTARTLNKLAAAPTKSLDDIVRQLALTAGVHDSIVNQEGRAPIDLEYEFWQAQNLRK